MKKILKVFSRNLLNSAKDLAPIVLVIGFFQLVVLQQNIPNLFDIALGTGFFSVSSHRVVLHWQPHWQLQ
jgi:hypothetical protein